MAAARRLRLAARAGTLRADASRAAMVCADLSRSERALGRRQQSCTAARRLPRCRTRAAPAAAVGARAGRLQPGHDDGAASRVAPYERTGGDRRLFRAAGTAA